MPGQYVAAAAGRHTGVSGGIDQKGFLRCGDNCLAAFKHQHGWIFRHKLLRDLQPVCLHLCGGAADQPCHFSRMRGQHERGFDCFQNIYMPAYGVYAICIQNSRTFRRLQQVKHHSAHLFAGTQPAADQHGGRAAA